MRVTSQDGSLDLNGFCQTRNMAHNICFRRPLEFLLLLTTLSATAGWAQSLEYGPANTTQGAAYSSNPPDGAEKAASSWFKNVGAAATTPPAALLADTVTLTSSPASPTAGQAVILTATVAPVAPPPATAAEQNPTGNVVFYSGTTAIGTVALVAAAGNDAVATLTISSLPAGIDQISAVYAGDLTFQTATSNVLVLTLQGFSIVPSPSNPPTNLTIVQGAAGTASFTVTGLGGFTGLVQVVCAVPQQDDMTCGASPQDVAPGSTVTFTVQTSLTNSTVSALRHPWPLSGLARAVSGTALTLLGIFVLPFGRRARVLLRHVEGRQGRNFCALLLLLVGVGGASLGCSSATVAPGAGTPLGVATLTITASANVNNAVVSQSVYLTVNVVPKASS
jgi:hypothetical protein